MLFSSAIYLLTELTLIIKAIYQFSRLNFYSMPFIYWQVLNGRYPVVVTVVFTIFTLIQGLICLRQYGRGLRAHCKHFLNIGDFDNSIGSGKV